VSDRKQNSASDKTMSMVDGQAGFSFIELMVVIVIMGLLT